METGNIVKTHVIRNGTPEVVAEAVEAYLRYWHPQLPWIGQGTTLFLLGEFIDRTDQYVDETLDLLAIGEIRPVPIPSGGSELVFRIYDLEKSVYARAYPGRVEERVAQFQEFWPLLLVRLEEMGYRSDLEDTLDPLDQKIIEVVNELEKKGITATDELVAARVPRNPQTDRSYTRVTINRHRNKLRDLGYDV
jgi:hypothetical protein